MVLEYKKFTPFSEVKEKGVRSQEEIKWRLRFLVLIFSKIQYVLMEKCLLGRKLSQRKNYMCLTFSSLTPKMDYWVNAHNKRSNLPPTKMLGYIENIVSLGNK